MSSIHLKDIIRGARSAEVGSVYSIWTGPGRQEEMGDNEKEKKQKSSASSDRVTLKKEIGLLSACAIIIGEFLTAFVFNDLFLGSSLLSASRKS